MEDSCGSPMFRSGMAGYYIHIIDIYSAYDTPNDFQDALLIATESATVYLNTVRGKIPIE
jgi:hypothetical protein